MTGLLAALFTAMLSSTIVATALPTIIGDLKGTQSQYTWIITASLLATTVTTPIWGKLADLFSKKVLVQSRDGRLRGGLGRRGSGPRRPVPHRLPRRPGDRYGRAHRPRRGHHGRDRRAPGTRPVLGLHGCGHGRGHGQRPAARRVRRRLVGVALDVLHLRAARDRRDHRAPDPAAPAHRSAPAADRLPGCVPHRRHRQPAAALGDLRRHRLRVALVALGRVRGRDAGARLGHPPRRASRARNRWYR